MKRIACLSGLGVLPFVLLALGCGGAAREPLLAEEIFHWIRQPIAFSPPPGRWAREGDNGGGMLGVRFVLRGGGGQCISIAGHRLLAERDRREAIARLITRRDSLTSREFLHELSLARPRREGYVSDREASVARAIDAELDDAARDYLGGSPGFVVADLEAALRRASEYEPTMAELLPHLLLDPGRSPNPQWWRVGYRRDTVVAGLPAHAADDTLITPDDGERLLYHEVFWVVKGCAFKATFQGRPENLGTFRRVVDSVRFPEAAGATPS